MIETRNWAIDARLKDNAPLADRWYELDPDEVRHDTASEEATKDALAQLRDGDYPGMSPRVADRHDFRARRVTVITEVETW